jgi:hypothetical protein
MRIWGFRKQDPELILKNPEDTSLDRATGFNEQNVCTFFQSLKSALLRIPFLEKNL